MSGRPGQPPIILWYRNDLRVSDHAALNAALEQNVPVIPVFIYDDDSLYSGRLGGASKWWLNKSLKDLDLVLRQKQSRLIFRRGDTADLLALLAQQTRASAVYFSHSQDAPEAAREDVVQHRLDEHGVSCRRFKGALLFEPEDIKTKTGTAFKVFTPYYRACMEKGVQSAPLPAPDRIQAPDQWPESEALETWRLYEGTPDWAVAFADYWTPGGSAAPDQTDYFLEAAVTGYVDDRDIPATAGTSALSPHLHFGEISPRQLWHRLAFEAEGHPAKSSGLTAFQRQLVWREFSAYLMHHWPDLETEPFNQRFRNFPWRDDPAQLALWQKGETGYPIVDAGMRQLWQTGWMHNRVRMIVASFLTKHLMLDWRLGAAWFWDTLVDADLANNTSGWQWVAGCGADASPYFRIFNPILQGQKFDPKGTYVRRWVPELESVADKFVHCPWLAPDGVAGYPSPIVDHKTARERALAAYKELKAEAAE